MMQSQIRAALESHINEIAQGRDLQMAWEGVAFNEGVGQRCLRVFVMPARSDSQDLAAKHRLYRGVLQVDVVMPGGKGMGEIERLAGQVITHCPKNLRLPVVDGFVQLTSVMSRGPRLINRGLITLPLSTYYRMDAV